MKALARTKDGKNSPFLVTLPLPALTPGYILIRVRASPINPSDVYFSKGVFGTLKYEPYVCGLEGAGKVVTVGPGVPPQLVGKNVAAWCNLFAGSRCVGMWSDYALVPYKDCVLLGADEDCEKFCGLFINPLTVLGMLRVAEEMGVKTIVNAAAMSALGKCLIKAAAQRGIAVIGIIRSKENLKELLALGAKVALDQTAPDFAAQLKEAAAKLGARLCFDPIGGTFTQTLIKAMPDNSVVKTYGVLSGNFAAVSEVKDEMLKRNVKNEFYHCGLDRVTTDPVEYKKALAALREDVAGGGKLFAATVIKRLGISMFKEAFEGCGKTATQGKTIFVFEEAWK